MTNGKQSLKQFFKKRRIYKPYLDIYLDVGFMRLKTELWRQSYERHEFTYIMLYWQFFKWSGKLRLYKPGVDL